MTTHSVDLIEADRMALVLIDIQERLAAAMRDEDRARVVDRCIKLARVAALVGAPIIVTRQYPKGLGPVVPELERPLETLTDQGVDIRVVDKVAFCCASEPDFEETLRATGRRQIVLAGMETHICVAQTALALGAQGTTVHVAADACCSRESLAHGIALDRMRAGGITVSHSESVMYEAVGVAGTERFKSLLTIVKE